MPTPKVADVDAYLAAQPLATRAALKKVRAAMRRALPSSEEAIKYNMPAYLQGGRAIASFAGWKDHYALYFVSPALFAAIREDLEGRDASKGIVRFDLEETVPKAVWARLAKESASAVAGGNGGAAKKAPKAKATKLAKAPRAKATKLAKAPKAKGSAKATKSGAPKAKANATKTEPPKAKAKKRAASVKGSP